MIHMKYQPYLAIYLHTRVRWHKLLVALSFRDKFFKS